MSGDPGHERVWWQVGPQCSDPSFVAELTRLALDGGEAEIEESKVTQDFWLELPFTEMPFTRQGSECQWGRVGVPLGGI